MKKILRWLLLIAFLSACSEGPGVLLPDTGAAALVVLSPQPARLDASVRQQIAALAPDQKATVIVYLNGQVDLASIHAADRAARLKSVILALQQEASNDQAGLLAYLKEQQNAGLVSQITPLWITNAVAVTATAQVITSLAARPEISLLSANRTFHFQVQSQPASQKSSAVLQYTTTEANIAAVHAPDLWNMGYTGQGIVVASMDSGVNYQHPDLASTWRGGTNSWYDPYGQHSTPYDSNGHGTMTMSIIVGGSAGGSAIGVAPGAQWISVKIVDDSGNRTDLAIHQGYQWLLDPDGNPNTPDAPQVVNNSWLLNPFGCDQTFQPDLQALRAAGIIPVFSGGNFGPGASTDKSPANNPAAFPIGAADNNGYTLGFASDGPNSCNGAIYPAMVAPGLNVRVASYLGGYTTLTGSSASAATVTGAIALLLSAFPKLPIDMQQSALQNSAIDEGAPGPDNVYGYGFLNILAAYQWIHSQGGQPNPTPTVVPTQQGGPAPTATQPILPQSYNYYLPFVMKP